MYYFRETYILVKKSTKEIQAFRAKIRITFNLNFHAKNPKIGKIELFFDFYYLYDFFQWPLTRKR